MLLTNPGVLTGAILLGVCLVLIITAAASRRTDRALYRLGLRYCGVAALVAALLIGLGFFVLASSQGSILKHVALPVAALVAGLVALFVFTLGAAALAAGLLVRASRSLAQTAWLIGPPIGLALAGVLYVGIDQGLRNFGPPSPYTPILRAGSIQLTLVRGTRAAEEWDLAATCRRNTTDQEFSINAYSEPNTSGPSVWIYFIYFDADQLRTATIMLANGHEISITPRANPTRGEVVMADGWTYATGSLEFSDNPPFDWSFGDDPPPPGETWSGSISWTCPEPA